MESALYTLDEASKLTGRSTEALRKRFLRGQIEGIGSKESNDGKVRIRLTPTQAADLRIEEEDAENVGNQASVNPPEGSQSKLIETLERQLSRAETFVDEARLELARERAARDEERTQWAARFDAAGRTYNEHLVALRAERDDEKRSAATVIEQLKSELSEAKAEAAVVVPRSRSIFGFFKRAV